MEESNPIEKHDLDFAAHTNRQSVLLANLGGIIAGLLAVFLCTTITYTAHISLGYFKVVFGVLTGMGVKYLGKGSGKYFGNAAGLYGVGAVIVYEWILATYFISKTDPSLLPRGFKPEELEFWKMAFSFSRILKEIGTAIFAYAIAYRIGKNPMKKDELDYLLEAKGISSEDQKYSQKYFKNKKRR